MLSQPPIEVLVDLIKHEIQQVETGDQGWWKVDIARDGHVDVVF